MNTVSDDQYVKICQACITHLSDRFVYEKGLFRQHASMNDVRAFKRQLVLDANAASRIRSESDPHIVVGVILACLKDMQCCLFSEVYDDVMRLEVTESTEAGIGAIQSWIVNVPSPKFELIRSLCTLLVRVSSLGGNESVLQQLTSNISPYVCRPMNTQFMSIRHQSDLKRSRIVFAFMIENASSIFTKDLVPRPPNPVNSSGGKRGQSAQSKRPVVPRLIDFNRSLNNSYSYDENIGTINSYDDTSDPYRASTSESDSSAGGQNPNSWEWNMLESITQSRIEFYLRPRENLGSSSNSASGSNNIFKNISSPLDFDSEAGLWEQLLGSSGVHAGASGGRPGTPATGIWSSNTANSAGGANRKDNKSTSGGSSNAARLLRRKLVAEVKQLRAEV
jgi:hypothetical protein